MDSALLGRLCCPDDHGHLALQSAAPAERDGIEGQLHCDVCGCSYPIEAEIPRFLSAKQNELCALQQSEMNARDNAYRAGSGGMDAWHAPEFDAVRAALGDCRGLSAL